MSPAAASVSLSRLRSATSSVASISSTKVKCGAVNFDRTIFSAIFLRRPASGMRSIRRRRAAAGARASRRWARRLRPASRAVPPPSSAATTSALVTRPCGPLPGDRREVEPVLARHPPGDRRGQHLRRRPTAAAATAALRVGRRGGAQRARRAAPGPAAAAAPSTSSVTSGWCTLAISPSLPWILTTLPGAGAGTVTVALSVITSTTAWSSLTVSPSFTSHLTISPSIDAFADVGELEFEVAMALVRSFRQGVSVRRCRRSRSIRPFMKNSAAR